MRRLKTYLGRRVLKTCRRGDVILVKLAGETLSDRPQWIVATRDQYRNGRFFKRVRRSGDH